MAAADGENEATAVRIFIGGVSSGVAAEDIERTFSSLGAVGGVELVRTNGRSFAYMDFRPHSEKSLAKLFSTYNGCTWKGGKLKLEKAKEHYLSRLKREWEENAKLTSVVPTDRKAEQAAGNLKSEQTNIEDTHLRIFFPKLRKVKSLPFKGSGKHKYSFQRVEVPPLPIHFCDCEEHCKQSEAASQKFLSSVGSGVYYEKELNIMNSVMDKLFEKENRDMTAHRDTELTTDAHVSNSSVDDMALEEADTASDTDVDNIVTNIGMRRRDDEPMQLTGADIVLANQRSLLGRTKAARDGSTCNNANSKKRWRTGLDDAAEVATNFKEHLVDQGKINEDEFSSILPRDKSCNGHPQELEAFAEPPPDKSQSESKNDPQSTKGNSWLQKSSWRDLVGQVGSSSFSITHVLPGISSATSLPKPPLNNLGIANFIEAETEPEKKKSKPFKVTKDTLPEDSVQKVRTIQVGDGQKEPQRANIHVIRRAIPKVGTSETCTFMRSAESEKEWAKTRTALRGYLKKKEKKTEEKDGSKLFRRN